MVGRLDESRISKVLDAVYEAAVDASAWPEALGQLCTLFDSHFADLFARTTDWNEMHGLAVGLDQADYEDQFLGRWSKRNVWSQANPAQFAGEVRPTWQMVSKQAVLSSPIYNEYLKPRDLNEGMRLVLWAGDRWLQHISLIRPWSAGPFGNDEMATGRMLLPHLQRASAASRGLRGLDALAAFDTLDRPAFLLDAQGRVMRQNAACDALLTSPGGLTVRARYLEAADGDDTMRLGAAVARAGSIGRTVASASIVTMQQAGLALTILPVRDRADRDLPAPRAVLVLVSMAQPRPPLTGRALEMRFGLTRAEADLAGGLLGGQALSDLAATRGRSVHTLRAQLARVMVKTGTSRQGELIAMLSQPAS